jgi:hypothetical protein
VIYQVEEEDIAEKLEDIAEKLEDIIEEQDVKNIYNLIFN